MSESIDLFNLASNNDSNLESPEICIICQENLAQEHKQVYEIPECKCKYHTNCLVTWFRSGSNRCPHCGNRGINHLSDAKNDEGVSYYGRGIRCGRYSSYKEQYLFIELKKMSKKEKCPILLKIAFEKYDKISTQCKDYNKECTDYNKLLRENKVEYAEARKMKRKLSSKKWSMRYKLRRQFSSIVNLPIYPLIIPQSLYMP